MTKPLDPELKVLRKAHRALISAKAFRPTIEWIADKALCMLGEGGEKRVFTANWEAYRKLVK